MRWTFKAQVKIQSPERKAKITRVVQGLNGCLQDCRNPKFIFIELPIAYRTSYEELVASDK